METEVFEKLKNGNFFIVFIKSSMYLKKVYVLYDYDKLNDKFSYTYHYNLTDEFDKKSLKFTIEF